MPYIKQGDRDELTPQITAWAESPGELNFQITCLIKEYVDYKALSYQTINDVVGALECAKAEFYRRVAVPYEKEKINLNGDVY